MVTVNNNAICGVCGMVYTPNKRKEETPQQKKNEKKNEKGVFQNILDAEMRTPVR